MTALELEANALQALNAVGITVKPTATPNDGYVVATKAGTQFVSATFISSFAAQTLHA